MSTDIGSYVHFEIFLLYYPSHTHASGILYACLVVCFFACLRKKVDHELKEEWAVYMGGFREKKWKGRML